jgi:preprotein translocase subunit SecY
VHLQQACDGTAFVLLQRMLYALWVVAGVLLLVWMLGVAGAYAVGNGIHFVLLVAILAVVSSLFTRPRTI